jgi:transposase-like protein|tara:strand:- start:137 stop:322 length:186 start_codon:yes stop_codon:yes gene_type:complete
MEKCPVCKSYNVTLQIGFEIGNYQCKKCGYVGSLILKDGKVDKKSKEILKDMKKYMKKNKL